MNGRFIFGLDGVYILPYCPVRGPAETRSGWGNTDCTARQKAPQSPRGNGSLQRHRWRPSARGRLQSDHINLRDPEDKAGLHENYSDTPPRQNFNLWHLNWKKFEYESHRKCTCGRCASVRGNAPVPSLKAELQQMVVEAVLRGVTAY